MKIVWKIFRLQEMSIDDQWTLDATICFTLIEAFENEFLSEEEAILFLGDSVPEFVRGQEFVIQRIFKQL